ncbi:MAG: arylsulfatase [Rikenellaceae bacterium]
MKKELLFLALPAVVAGHATAEAKGKESKNPNIIFILADDMGYGDVSGLNENSKIHTPNLDKMISNGAYFSDAHTSSSVSTPSRYSILTGRYNWRSTLKQGVLSGYSRHLIPTYRTTMASMLKRANYNTGCVGKWHLGWDWHYTEQPTNIDNLSADDKGVIDYSVPIQNGPTALGFDYFFGIAGSLDMPPYVYVQNDMVTAAPDHEFDGWSGFAFCRKGPTGPDFVHEEVLPTFTDKAIEFVKDNGKKKDPFFLYLPYPAPHTPILPTEKWMGVSKTNQYGDFVMYLDHEVGRILTTLEEMGIDDNTIVVFTTDNGCSTTARFSELWELGHYPSYIYRGNKADLFEGGHRVPCLVQWPAVIEAGSRSDQTVCMTDFFSTFADIAGLDVADEEGEDSYSLLSAFKDPSCQTPIRDAIIHHSITGEFSIRVGDWKLLASPSSGGWSAPRPNNAEALVGLPPIQLYNLKSDPAEKFNLQDQYPEKVAEMFTLLRKQVSDGRSTPGELQSNEVRSPWHHLDKVFSEN